MIILWEHTPGDDYRTLKRKSNKTYYRIIKEFGDQKTRETVYYVCERERRGITGTSELFVHEVEEVTPRPKR